MKASIPLYGSGFLAEGTLQAAGCAADGIIATLHYSDSRSTLLNKQFRPGYAKAYKSQSGAVGVLAC